MARQAGMTQEAKAGGKAAGYADVSPKVWNEGVRERSQEAMTTALPPMDGWNDLSWKTIERNVFKLQARIFKAEQSGNGKTVRKLQKLLLKSRSARLLVIRRVTQDNQGKVID